MRETKCTQLALKRRKESLENGGKEVKSKTCVICAVECYFMCGNTKEQKLIPFFYKVNLIFETVKKATSIVAKRIMRAILQ